jgi:hypothetical protein
MYNEAFVNEVIELFYVCPQVQDVSEDDRNRRCQHGGQVVLQRGANQVFRAQEREGVQEVLVVGQVPQVQAPEAGLPQGQPLLLSWHRFDAAPFALCFSVFARTRIISAVFRGVLKISTNLMEIEGAGG